jgi:hypothetical protein
VIPADLLERIVDFLRNPIVTAVVIWIAICALAAYVLITWISSRGRFIFLDNVARERAAIVAPFLAAIAALIHAHSLRLADFFVLLPLPLMLLPVGIVAGFVHLCRISFVEPIMYRDDVGVMMAWKRFLALFVSRPLPFVVYAFFSLVLLAAALAAVIAFGIGTLTIGFFLLATPYIGSVVLLPLEVTFRALGPEFLAQFGPEYAALGAPLAPMAPPAATPTSAPTTG